MINSENKETPWNLIMKIVWKVGEIVLELFTKVLTPKMLKKQLKNHKQSQQYHHNKLAKNS